MEHNDAELGGEVLFNLIHDIAQGVVRKFFMLMYSRPLKVKLDAYGVDGPAIEPKRAHLTDAGLDIMTPKSFTLPAGGSATIHTGVHIELPGNTVGILKSKSGLHVCHDIIGEGVIDEGYDGEIVVKLHNLGEYAYHFERGQKVIQLLVMPVLYCPVNIVDEVRGGERGSDGFGSTGA